MNNGEKEFADHNEIEFYCTCGEFSRIKSSGPRLVSNATLQKNVSIKAAKP